MRGCICLPDLLHEHHVKFRYTRYYRSSAERSIAMILYQVIVVRASVEEASLQRSKSTDHSKSENDVPRDCFLYLVSD